MDLHKRHYLGSSKLLGLIRRSIDHELPMPSISLAPLSPKQQRQLIRGSDLGPKARSALRYWLRNNPKLAVFAQIPMLLTLFCDCFRATNASQLPAGLYGAIDVAIAGRMGLVGEPIPDQVRKIAEDIASALAAPPTLVLEPTPSTVYGTDPPPDYVSADLFDKAVSLLIRAKIVQFRELTSIEFTHRVFREQFAAKRLIQQQEAFDAVLLFTEPEWSAPIITTLLNGLENVKLKLLNGAAELLARDTVDVAGVVADISLFLVDDAYRLPVRFEWPADALMTLRIIAASRAGLGKSVPAEIRRNADILVVSSFVSGTRREKGQALQVLTMTSEEVGCRVLERVAFSGSSELNREAIGQLSQMPEAYKRLRASTCPYYARLCPI